MFESQATSFMFSNLPGAWSLLPSDDSACPVWWNDQHHLAVHLVSLCRAPSDPVMLQKMSLKALEQGFQLIHLWEDVWHRSQAVVCSRLKVLCGQFQRIHGRQTDVRKLTHPEARGFLEAYNLYGSPNSRYKYGLFRGSTLVAVATFGGRRPLPRAGGVVQSYELIRFASLPDVRVSGGLSKLLYAFVRDEHPGDVMTYVDLEWGDGSGFRKLGFEQTSITEPLPFWVDPSTMVRYAPQKMPLVDTPMRELEEYRRSMSYIRVYNAGNIKFLWVPKTDVCR